MNDRGEKRKLAAIVMADVVGYSRMMGADESGTLATLKGHRREFVDPMIAAHRGTLVKTTGDGFLIEFPSAVEATRFAIDLQRGMAARNAQVADVRRVAFRVGVNIGDIVVERGDIFGDGVNVAARLETLAEAGGICLSRAAHEQVRHVVDVGFVELGPQTMKNIRRPIEVFALPASVIAELPFVVVESPKFRRWHVIAAVTATIVIICAGIAFVARTSHPTQTESLKQQLDLALSRVFPSMSDKMRTKVISSFLATGTHRALALAPKAKAHWAAGDWATRAEAEEKTLERCQVAFDEPCSLIAADGDFIGTTPARDMPRAHYAGAFDPFWIPGVRMSVIKRPDVSGYAGAASPKAAAYSMRGLVFIVTGASSQKDAETRALKACNDEPTRKNVENPCLLYAIDNQVVLPERRSVP